MCVTCSYVENVDELGVIEWMGGIDNIYYLGQINYEPCDVVYLCLV